jgi:hypothetical protein
MISKLNPGGLAAREKIALAASAWLAGTETVKKA